MLSLFVAQRRPCADTEGMVAGRVHSSKIISKNEDPARVAKGITKLYGVSNKCR